MTSTQPDNSDDQTVNIDLVGTPSEEAAGAGSVSVITPNSVNKEVKLTFVRQKRQAQFFVERLGDDAWLDMILIPGGTFLMGSPEDEPERSSAEGPQHEVAIPTFFMSRYPVTQTQWKMVAGFLQVNQELAPDPSRFKGENRPVEQVSWHDAVEFCDRLSAHASREYRLPTEAEWEYACRAGTTTPFHFGRTLTTDIANYNGKPTGEYRGETTPVAHFGIANAFGLCDMHGNVYEWCQDYWHSNYESAPTDGSAWLADGDATRRLVRGGSGRDHPRNCRSAYRLYYSPDYHYSDIGFRVVCSTRSAL